MKIKLNEKEIAFLSDIHTNRNAHDEPLETRSEIKRLNNFFLKLNGKEPRQTQKLINLLRVLVSSSDATDSVGNNFILTSKEHDALYKKLEEVK